MRCKALTLAADLYASTLASPALTMATPQLVEVEVEDVEALVTVAEEGSVVAEVVAEVAEAGLEIEVDEVVDEDSVGAEAGVVVQPTVEGLVTSLAGRRPFKGVSLSTSTHGQTRLSGSWSTTDQTLPFERSALATGSIPRCTSAPAG